MSLAREQSAPANEQWNRHPITCRDMGVRSHHPLAAVRGYALALQAVAWDTSTASGAALAKTIVSNILAATEPRPPAAIWHSTMWITLLSRQFRSQYRPSVWRVL
jgi:hypothetical protein